MPNLSVLDETSKMRLEFEVDADVALIRPIGILDEDSKFPLIYQTLLQMKPLLKGIRFDLGFIKRFNSCGIRDWVLLMEKVIPLAPCTFFNMNEYFVEQANMVNGVFGKRKEVSLETFHVPYRCIKCESDHTFLLKTAEIPFEGNDPIAPQKNCPTCAGPLEFDWLPAEYFHFIKAIRK